jgi:hypothetical protein
VEIHQPTKAEALKTLEERRYYLDLDPVFKKLLRDEYRESVMHLKEAASQATDYEMLRSQSAEFFIPIDHIVRSDADLRRMPDGSKPHEIWWRLMYSYSVIATGHTIEESFERAKVYIQKYQIPW